MFKSSAELNGGDFVGALLPSTALVRNRRRNSSNMKVAQKAT